MNLVNQIKEITAKSIQLLYNLEVHAEDIVVSETKPADFLA